MSGQSDVDEEAAAETVIAGALMTFEFGLALALAFVKKPDGDIDEGATKTLELLGLELELVVGELGLACGVVEAMIAAVCMVAALVLGLPSWTVSVSVTVTVTTP